MRHKVFLSYSSIDAQRVEKLAELLHVLGVRVIRDAYDLRPGDRIDEWVVRSLENHADLVIVAMSNNSLTSQWVEKELAIAEAVRQSKKSLPIVYVNVSPDTNVPDRIRAKLYVDLAVRKREEYAKQLLKLCGALLNRPPYWSLGVYDVFSDWSDLDNRRENAVGEPGCTIYQFLECAREEIVAVGLWFANLFGNDQGSLLADILRNNRVINVDLYMPDPDIPEAMAQLAQIHEGRERVIPRLSEFVNDRFVHWASHGRLLEEEARRCRLHFLRFIPTASILAVDPSSAGGRIIVDFYAPAVTPRKQLKVEMRYPGTPVYAMAMESLNYIRSPASVTRTLG